ncbi:MAG: BREX-6 system BrxE protein [Sandaracinus sp.]|nr:BREX-6 system BrxE protein [Sandaracinus sp.]MCB9613496.1 BREX-6 system BrxE protein [Sandaracinus sp.]
MTDLATTSPAPIPASTLDFVLDVQLAVAWAGEGLKSERRLGWWASMFAFEFGGDALFADLLPNTHRWAVLRAAREAARRKDAELRAKADDPDRLVSLFRLGFALDEALEERFADRVHDDPRREHTSQALAALIDTEFSSDAFAHFLEGALGKLKLPSRVDFAASPTGRRLSGEPPTDARLLVAKLAGALLPLAEAYPLPHFKR